MLNHGGMLMKRSLWPILLVVILTFLSTVWAESPDLVRESSTESPSLLDLLDGRVMWSSPSLDLVQMKEHTQNLLLPPKTRIFYSRWYDRYSAWLNLP